MPKSDFGFTDECCGNFVCAYGTKTLERYARYLYPYIPHWCLKLDCSFEYYNASPITEIEFSNRIRNSEGLRQLLLKSLLQTTVINLFTNPFNLSSNGK